MSKHKIETENRFAHNLAIRLREKRITQKELAQNIGLSEPCVANYINNKTQPNIDTIVKICNYLNCSIDELIMGKQKINLETINDEATGFYALYKMMNDRGKDQFFAAIENITYNPKNLNLQERNQILLSIEQLKSNSN